MRAPRVWLAAAILGLAAGTGTGQCVAHWIPDQGAPFSNGTVNALKAMPNGDLIAGGQFQSPVGSYYGGRVARRSGTAWSSLGPDMSDGVRALAVMANGDLLAGGSFAFVGDLYSPGVARWNGQSWSRMVSQYGTQLGGGVPSLIVINQGSLAGNVFAGSARWNGSAWVFPLGPSGPVRALALTQGGELIAGGEFTQVITEPATNLAHWIGRWASFGTGVTGPFSFSGVYAIVVMPNGDLVVGGNFSSAGGAPAANVARWDGTAWAPLGTGLGDQYGLVLAMTRMPNGDLIAGGSFNTAGGVAASNIARWDGNAWHPLDSGTDNVVYALEVMPDGKLAVGGAFRHAGGRAAANLAFCEFGAALQSNPMDTEFCEGSAVSLTLGVQSNTPPTYAWRHNTTPIGPALNPSAATNTLIIPNAQPADAGSYDCIITNACGSVTSNAAALSLRRPYDRACGGPGCDPDVNQDGQTDQADIDYLINFVAGGDNPNNIDPDFNHDGNADQSDIDALLNVLAGGNCP
ncbi:MAG: immunoglobulin domain-containing protein [Phycisphaerales bacterium]